MIPKHLFTLFLLSFALPTFPQAYSEEKSDLPSHFVKNLWPARKKGEQAIVKERVLPDRGDDVRRISDITEPSFTVYRVELKDRAAPAVLVFPGGGYSILAIDKEGTEIAAWLNSFGITAAVLKYRVPNDRKGAFQDAQRAMRLVRHHAKKWNIDPECIGVIGFSAGGHLAARLSTDYEKRTYSHLDEADTLSCRPDFCIMVYPAYLESRQTKGIAAELPVTGNIPPTFIVHTEDDRKFVSGSKAYHEALKKAGVPCELQLFPAGGHGYGLRPSPYRVSRWPQECEKWLTKSVILPVEAAAEQITLKSLLNEMADRSELSRTCFPAFLAKAATSYDRESIFNDPADGLYIEKNGRDWGKGWFANRDFGHCIRVEQTKGRTENVLMDDRGPGAIVRWWATAYNEGIIRIYLDGATEPVIEMKPAELVGGDKLAFYPFSFKASDDKTNPNWRGHNLYLPIPYGKSCKVTWEGTPSYYQIGYRKYAPGTKVKTFTMVQLRDARDTMIRVAERLTVGSTTVSGTSVARTDVVLAPEKSLALTMDEPGAITRLLVQLAAEDYKQALRSTVVAMTFDGKRTAWIPVGALGGVGYSKENNDTYCIKVDQKTGTVSSYYVMPFRETAAITLTNHGNQDVAVKRLEATLDDYQWTDRSLLFNATWFELRNISTKARSDLNYVTVKGAGRYVGTSITIFNTCTLENNQTWWGEGDDKVHVDGEAFPSIFGTGTEDYFGYAYCRPQRFCTPFISQPRGEGNKKWGYSNNNRYHLLDSIPFNKSVQFDMEIWHPFRKNMNYAAATFFYARPGATHNIVPDVDSVRHKVALHRDDVIDTSAPLITGADIEEAINQKPPAIDIATGWEIPSEGYCDQPFVVKLADGTWLCVMTTGKGHEGQTGQHIVSCRSRDRGKTWGPLVDIEPADGPEASWALPYLTGYGRVYVFYTYNAGNLREIIAETAYARKRVDTLGEYAIKYSDDGGKSWSGERWFIPVRETAIDRSNPYQGKVRFFWGVGKPIRHKGAVYLGFAKVGKFGNGFIEISESWFLRCADMEVERDPGKLAWETLPEGDSGLESPEGSIAEEVNLTSLSDGSLFCTYRTVAGHPCHAYSRDDGKSWTGPAFMTYRPGGKPVDHPRAANFVRRLDEGPWAGRYIYWMHNHGGKGYQGRNPAYLLGGIEREGPDGKVIHWGRPVAVLYDKDEKVRISYPDFIWDEGLYITETQKTIARVHRIPDELLRSLWVPEKRVPPVEPGPEGDAGDRTPLP